VTAPVVDPFDFGWLDVGDGNEVYWEWVGNPDGSPAVHLHGGPGFGCSLNNRRAVDVTRFRTLLFDQRGCGRSRPHASDPTTDITVNTTAHLIADIEQLREHFGIDNWLVFGGSWGSTLGLAYAEEHPERVNAMVLVAITTSSRREVDWLYRGVGRFFPEQWERFVTCAGDRADPVAAYAQLMEEPDAATRLRAAREWCAWEDAVLSAESFGNASLFSNRSDAEILAFVRICARYVANAAWLPDGSLLANADRLAGVPGALIHGRLDMSAPLETAWNVARAWPGSQLHVIEDAGHKGNETMANTIAAAIDSVTRR
jgi:proline iminopeptidase